MSISPQQREHAVDRSSRIFAVIRDAAGRGDECPTNPALAERFGCGTATIVRSIAFLEACGMIEVERGSSSRVVTIRATGERTSGKVGRPVNPGERPWTDEETDLLADMMAEGKGYGEIAKELERTKWSVRSRWSRLVESMGWQAQ